MPKAIKICRVCGKEYEACHTNKSSNGTFRWQDVACSPECGAIYLAQIRASRKKDPVIEDAPDTSNNFIDGVIESVSKDSDVSDEDESEINNRINHHRNKKKKRN